MEVIAFRERTLGAIITQYISSRSDPSSPVSLSAAVKAVKLIAGSGVEDRELAAVIATAAIANRRNVEFDLEIPAGLATSL